MASVAVQDDGKPVAVSSDTRGGDTEAEGGRAWREIFGEPSVPIPSRAFFAMRAVLLAFWIACMVYSLVKFRFQSYWLIYFTHWGMSLELVWLAFNVLTTWKAIWGKDPAREGAGRPWFASVTLWLYATSPTVALLLTLLYWGLVHPRGKPPRLLAVEEHAFNLLVAAVELILWRQPLSFAHVYSPMLVASTYITFTYIYYKAGGTDAWGGIAIYPPLNWSKGGTIYMVVGIILVGVPIFYSLFFCFSRVPSCRSKGAKVEEPEALHAEGSNGATALQEEFLLRETAAPPA